GAERWGVAWHESRTRALIMTNSNRFQPLSVSVLSTAEEVAIDMRDRRLDSVTLFGDLDEAARDQLAHDAWAIGLRALANAHAAAHESKLKDVGTSLLTDIDRQLKLHVEQQQQ